MVWRQGDSQKEQGAERERKRETEWRGMEGGMERESKRDRGRAQVDVSAWMNGIPTAYVSGPSTFSLEQELFPNL